LLVQDEIFEGLRKKFITGSRYGFLYRVEQQLQRCHPLLAVNYLVPSYASRDRRLRLINDRTKEMRRYLLSSLTQLEGDVTLGYPHDVIPKRRPLIFLIPHIGALKGRYLVMLFALKQISRATRIGFHLNS